MAEPEAENTYAEPGGTPEAAEFVAPPLILVGLGMLGLVFLSWATQRLWWRTKVSNFRRHRKLSPESHKVGDFISPEERNMMFNFSVFQNKPSSLLKISLTALLSMAFCPVTLYAYNPLVKLFWPPSKFDEVPSFNEAIEAFLAPAGLVYAISFGFAVQEACKVQIFVANTLSEMVNRSYNLAQNMSGLSLFSLEDKYTALYYIKQECFIWMNQILADSSHVCDHYSSLHKLVVIIDKSQRTIMKPLDNLLTRQLLKDIRALEELSLKSLGRMCGCMNILQWFFLEALAYLSFFGILMVHGQSYKFQIAICVVTVFSISMFCFILADLDSPFHGFFRADIQILLRLLRHLEDAAKKNSESLCGKFTIK